MQARSIYLRTIMPILLSFLLITALAGALPVSHERASGVSSSGQVFRSHSVSVKPVIYKSSPLQISTSNVKPVRFACQSNSNPQPALCYGPYQIRQAYGVTGLLNKHFTGKGSSITIIDAYGSPTIRKDLQAFDTTWGFPHPQLNILTPFGTAGSDSAWVAETSLDVEWAHAMAPDATINLVVAKSSNDVELYNTLSYVVKHNLGDVVSLSFGENELCVDPKLRKAEQHIFSEAVRKGMTLVAATGDFGSAQLTCDSNSYQEGISFPSSDPLVTAVGGTTLSADATTGRYLREAAWNESGAFNKATGGGYSKIYAVPAFQRDIIKGAKGRAVPDISLNASVNGGVLVYQSRSRTSSRPAVNIMGGTSVAAPELAGILADGVQMAHHRLGSINPALYKVGASSNYSLLMNDITSGDNVLLSTGLSGYKAGDGWDATTGWGSPRQARPFLRALIAADPVMVSPKPAPIPLPGQTPEPRIPGATPTRSASPVTGGKSTTRTRYPSKLASPSPTATRSSKSTTKTHHSAKFANPSPTPTWSSRKK